MTTILFLILFSPNGSDVVLRVDGLGKASCEREGKRWQDSTTNSFHYRDFFCLEKDENKGWLDGDSKLTESEKRIHSSDCTGTDRGKK